MATLTVQRVDANAEVTPAYQTLASGGDVFPNDGRTFIHFLNTNAAARTVTFTSQVTDNQGATNNISVTVPLTSGDRMAGPFNPSRFNLSGNVVMTYDVNPPTNLTAAIVRLGDAG